MRTRAWDEASAMLPAAEIAGELNRLLADHPTLVVTAPPGAGKSTLLPLSVLEGWAAGGRLVMLEPRRLAARGVAERMAYLLGERVGETVGYRMRFEQRVSARTRIEVVTEGVLTRRLQDDPALEGVTAVIFDEFHERSLTSDLALALVRESRRILRPDLRVLLMSATLDAEPLCRALDAPLLESEGRMFPVEIRRGAVEATPENAAATVARAIREAHGREEGDILAFLPGEGDIRRCAELLGESLAPTRVLPLYGMLAPEAQRAALAPSPPGGRKVVLATPVAETSLTIEGVRIVVDSGLCRRPVFDARRGLSTLETVRISRDMADQRAGRAGRLESGVCYRLWSLPTELRMAPTRQPEICAADLAPLVLTVAAWGENHPEALPWLTPPPEAHLSDAQSLLRTLGALDDEGRITPHGRALAALPCHPRIAAMLLRAERPAERALAADIAALLEEKDPLPDESSAALDLRVRALRSARRGGRPTGRWARMIRIAEQYRSTVRAEEDNADPDPYEVGALLAAAFPERIAKALLEGVGRFQLATGDPAVLDAADPLCAAAWLAVADTGGGGRIFLAAPLSEADLAPYLRRRDLTGWDPRGGRVVARRESRVGQLVVSSVPLPDIPRETLVEAVCAAVRKEGVSLLDFDERVQQLQRRVAAVAAWHPELELPDLSTEAVLARPGDWLPPVLGRSAGAAELKRLDLAAALRGLLSYKQQEAVDRLAPTHVTVPTGSRIPLEYRQGADAPVLRVRLQECFGLVDTPRVDDGRRPVLMELLSPGYKPVQLTSDLRSFWTGAYFEVRKELRRRYPKHAWPDDPLSAEPVRGCRRK